MALKDGGRKFGVEAASLIKADTPGCVLDAATHCTKNDAWTNALNPISVLMPEPALVNYYCNSKKKGFFVKILIF